ncbi:MAG: hypothetical protein K2N35_03265, partial [Muribaculaceae bacterium]|nr:hypothetical protein [Muribaculaceae bacterium]
LYQLSHGVIFVGRSSGLFPIASAKLQPFFESTKFFGNFFQKTFCFFQTNGLSQASLSCFLPFYNWHYSISSRGRRV